MDVPNLHPKPIFSIQGLTDPLFSSLQTEDEINILQTANPTYPVWAFFGDLGHSYALNPLNVWQDAHNESNPEPTAHYDTLLAGVDEDVRAEFMGSNIAECYARMGDPLPAIA